jgi:calcineurin-like phosphoesterase family protein
MDRTMISNYNKLVEPNDTVYFIGDFSLRGIIHKNDLENIVRKLKGHKHLILGSHDKLHAFDYVDIGFETVHTYLEIEIEGYKLYLFHDPAIATGLLDSVCICGHVHNLFKTLDNIINVGVDVWDFKPVSIKQIMEIIEGD